MRKERRWRGRGETIDFGLGERRAIDWRRRREKRESRKRKGEGDEMKRERGSMRHRARRRREKREKFFNCEGEEEGGEKKIRSQY